MRLSPPESYAQDLNRGCHCISVDKDELEHNLKGRLEEKHRNLFSPYPVFVDPQQVQQIEEAIQAIEALANTPRYRAVALGNAPAIAEFEPGTRGVMFGYDFHLTETGPRLIEVNTNAGGALLHRELSLAQRACCWPVAKWFEATSPTLDPAEPFAAMFVSEWQLFSKDTDRRNTPLKHVAIIDKEPEQQFLYPEFQLFARLLGERGVTVSIVDPTALEIRGNRLFVTPEASREHSEIPVDLVYNRLTDFYLEDQAHSTLRTAYLGKWVALTPAPRHYALFADKRNLISLSDEDLIRTADLSERERNALRAYVPEAKPVSSHPDELAALYKERKNYFFKPATGHASRGAYDGKKITRKVFDRIASGKDGPYIAQAKIPPSLRQIRLAGEESPAEVINMKVDLRAVVYDGEIQQLSSRLYRGQTTNLRTVGGGLATVITARDPGVVGQLFSCSNACCDR